MPRDKIIEALDTYDDWLRQHCRAIDAELAEKRQLLAADTFAFLRGTCFRFAAHFAAKLPDLLQRAAVPSCGDAHIENFGTWRDQEGRLVWGVNDLDEAAILPWPADLVRLLASALLVREKSGAKAKELAATVRDAYAKGLAAPGSFVLDEEHAALRAFVLPADAARAAFWKRLDGLRAVPQVPADFRQALIADLPVGAEVQRIVHRRAGLGSLGRPRFTLIANWAGGRLVREAKTRLPSAWLYAEVKGAEPVEPIAIMAAPGRAADPWYRMMPEIIVRRLAPDSRRLSAPDGHTETLLTQLGAMATELGHVHATGRHAHKAEQELARLSASELRDAAETMAALVEEDHAALAARQDR
jgi:hypothetical protein